MQFDIQFEHQILTWNPFQYILNFDKHSNPKITYIIHNTMHAKNHLPIDGFIFNF